MSTIEIFCCYARKDLQLLNDLKKHLMPMQHSAQIHIWADTDIDAGEEWEKEIDNHLNTAQIILLLISPDFIASNYCYSVEMMRALERHEQGEARVIPIILRPTDWQNTLLRKLQALPTGAKPVTSALNQDDALLDAAKGVRKAVVEMQKKISQENQQLPILEKREENRMGFGKKPNKMNERTRVAYIAVAVIVISALIEGIVLLHNTTLARTTKPTPTSAATPATTVRSTSSSTVTPTLTVTPTSTSTVAPTPSPSTPVLVRPGTPFLADLMTSPNNEDQWDVITQSYVTCGFSNGGYDVKVPANTVGGCSTNASVTNLTDFIYEIDMTIVSGVTMTRVPLVAQV